MGGTPLGAFNTYVKKIQSGGLRRFIQEKDKD